MHQKKNENEAFSPPVSVC